MSFPKTFAVELSRKDISAMGPDWDATFWGLINGVKENRRILGMRQGEIIPEDTESNHVFLVDPADEIFNGGCITVSPYELDFSDPSGSPKLKAAAQLLELMAVPVDESA